MNPERKTILITGAAGFIGSNLCSKLLSVGYHVIGMDNFSYGDPRNMASFVSHKNFQFHQRDISADGALSDINSDILIHLASQKIPRYSSSYQTIVQNDKMIYQCIEHCLKVKSKLLFASTSDIYGKNPDLPYTEDSNSVLGSTTIKRWAYAISKLHSEHLILGNHEEFGLDYTIFRLFGSYGPNQNCTWWGGPQSVFIQNILEGKKIEIHGDGTQTRTFTYIEDHTDGILKFVSDEAANNEIFNIAGEPDQEIQIKDLALLICELMNVEYKEYVSFIPYSTFGNYEDVMRRVPDISRIKKKLNFEPKYSLREGLLKTIQWQTNRFKS